MNIIFIMKVYVCIEKSVFPNEFFFKVHSVKLTKQEVEKWCEETERDCDDTILVYKDVEMETDQVLNSKYLIHVDNFICPNCKSKNMYVNKDYETHKIGKKFYCRECHAEPVFAQVYISDLNVIPEDDK